MQKTNKFSFLLVIMSTLMLILSGCGEATSTPGDGPTLTTVATSVASVSSPVSTATLQTGQPTTLTSTSSVASTTITSKEGNATAKISTNPSQSTSPAQNSQTVATSIATPKPTANSNGFIPHTFDRVFIIVLENTSYQPTLDNAYMAGLAKKGTLLTNYYAISHPSYPNYLALTGGSTFGQTDDGQQDLDKTNLADLMEPAGISWKVYAEGLPKPCFLGVQAGSYVRKHVPFASYVDIQKNPSRCNKITSSEELKSDVAADKLPQYSMYIPDLNNDGHDTGVKYAAEWLNGFLSPLLDNPKFMQGTLVVVTFDEDHNDNRNHIYTALLGQSVQIGATNNTRYDHYSLLRTIEDNFGIGNLGREDAKATDITGVWK